MHYCNSLFFSLQGWNSQC